MFCYIYFLIFILISCTDGNTKNATANSTILTQRRDMMSGFTIPELKTPYVVMHFLKKSHRPSQQRGQNPTPKTVREIESEYKDTDEEMTPTQPERPTISKDIGVLLHKYNSEKISDTQNNIASKWPLGIIPYFFDSNSFDSNLLERVRQRMFYIESISCVRFKLIPEKPGNDYYWVHMTNPNRQRECSHNVKTFNREVRLILGLDGLKHRDILHSLMHAIGFKDEVTHPHRDQFIRILWDNIQPKYRQLFGIEAPRKAMPMEYDPLSIMQFHDRSFTMNGHATIASVVPGLQIRPAETRLSLLDKKKLRRMFSHECQRLAVEKILDTCKTVMHSGNDKHYNSNDNKQRVNSSKGEIVSSTDAEGSDNEILKGSTKIDTVGGDGKTSIYVGEALLKPGKDTNNKKLKDSTNINTIGGDGSVYVEEALFKPGKGTNNKMLKGSTKVYTAAGDGSADADEALFKPGKDTNNKKLKGSTNIDTANGDGSINVEEALLKPGKGTNNKKLKGSNKVYTAASDRSADADEALFKPGKGVSNKKLKGSTNINTAGGDKSADVDEALFKPGKGTNNKKLKGSTNITPRFHQGYTIGGDASVDIEEGLFKPSKGTHNEKLKGSSKVNTAGDDGSADADEALFKSGKGKNNNKLKGSSKVDTAGDDGSVDVDEALFKPGKGTNNLILKGPYKPKPAEGDRNVDVDEAVYTKQRYKQSKTSIH